MAACFAWSRQRIQRTRTNAICLLLGLVLAGVCGAPASAGGNRTYPTGTQSHQPNDAPCSNPFGCGRGGVTSGAYPAGGDVYCQQSPGMPMYGPYSHTGTQTPCLQSTQPTLRRQRKLTFNYYYLNGINTPYTSNGRGNYQWDWGMIKGNLLDQGRRVGVSAGALLPPIRAMDETDSMVDQTPNRSGRDPLIAGPLGQYCDDASKGRLVPTVFGDAPGQLIADTICGSVNQGRGYGFLGQSPGDVVESFRQSMGWDLFIVKTGMEAFTSQQAEVRAVTSLILRKFAAEQAPGSLDQNYFVLIAHSQGNFFAEGVAYRLMRDEGTAGAYIFRNRLGILSFAPPRNYASVTGQQGFASRVAHLTRGDDIINTLLGSAPPGGKVPWPRTDNLPSLWPWPASRLDGGLNGLTAFGEMVSRGPPPGCQPAGQPQCDGALYTPFMNAHLLDNYLTSPDFTMPGQPINKDVANEMGLRDAVSPRPGPPLLAASRNALLRLKLQMLGPQMASQQLQGGSQPASPAPGFPLPSGAALGNMLGDMVNGFLRQ